MIGRTLGQYEIRDRIGSGGMGDVYAALDTDLGRLVAAKTLPAELASDVRRIERFRREARALAALNHPNIVTVYSVEQIDGVHLLTMELIEGKSLDQLIGETGLGLGRFFEIGVPLADALAAAHAGGVIHRDLKPSNVMVSDSGRVKVLDFGLAKLSAGEASADSLIATEEITVEGHIIGTVPYMAPEQLAGATVDARTDIFAAGVLLYEMATGVRPFGGGTTAELAASILHTTPPDVDERRGDTPHHLARIVRQCLEKDPERRIQSAKDLRNALVDLERELTTDELSASRPTLATPLRKRKRAGLGLAATVAALLLVALFAWLGRDRPPPSELPPVSTEAQALLDQGHLFELRGQTRADLQTAEERYRSALAHEPDNPVVQARLAAHLAAMQMDNAETGRLEEIRQLADAALNAAPDLVEGWIARSRVALLDDDLPAAHAAANRAVDLAPTDYRGYTLRGEVLMSEERLEEGMQQLQRGTELAGTDTRGRLALAYHLWVQGRTDEAIVEYRSVLDYNPDSPSALNNLGIIYGQQGRYLDAIPLLKRLIIVKRDIDAAINLAVCYFYLDRLEDSIAAYQQALEIEPDHPWAQHGMAEAYEKLGEEQLARRWFEASIDAYDQRIAAGASRPRILGLRAVCAAKLGRFEQAIADIAEAEQLDPDYPPILFNAAQVQALAGNLEAMIEKTRRAIAAGYARQEFERDLSFRPYLDQPGFRAVLESAG